MNSNFLEDNELFSMNYLEEFKIRDRDNCYVERVFI